MFWRKIIFIISLLFIFTTDVYAQDKGFVCYWVFDDDLNLKYTMEEVSFENNITSNQKVSILFDKFFNECNNNYMNFVPEGTQLIYTDLQNGQLDLYVSSEIKSYGGGSEWELTLTEGILRTAFSLPEVKSITLYIDGIIDCLPEGIILDNYRREDFIIE